MALAMTTNRNSEPVNTTLDRTEHILADLTIRLDRLEINVESNPTVIAALTHRLDTFIDQTNTTVDRLAEVFASYMDQATVERNDQRRLLVRR